MTALGEIGNKWSKRLEEWRALGVVVNGEHVATEILSDLRALEQLDMHGTVTIREASAIGGYSIDHLQRLVARGQLENLGRKHRPRIRRSDVPVKPGYGLRANADDVSSMRRRIVASVATGNTEDV